MAIYNIHTFPYIEIKKLDTVHNSKKNIFREKYKDIITTFDIETTKIKKIRQSIMYVWQWHFNNIGTVLGRTWEDLRIFIHTLEDYVEEGEYIVTYVHFLSHEFQYLRGLYDDFEKNFKDIFSVKKRKVLRFKLKNFLEFKCSYYLSNMSLDEYTKKMNVKNLKLSGDIYDYNKIRYPWTELSDSELQYILNDVIGLSQCIEKDLLFEKDTLKTIPLTNTGYVRRDVKKSIYPIRKNTVEAIYPKYEVYNLLRKCFRGGNTHANRYYANRFIENVKTYDISSCYPNVMCNYMYPIKKFITIEKSEKIIRRYIYEKNIPLLMEIECTNVKLKDMYEPVPYISFDKSKKEIENYVLDNGRVLKCEKIILYLTDIDFIIIDNMYNFKIDKVNKLYKSSYGKLPRGVIEQNIEYFKRKTELKGDEEMRMLYNKSKNKLCSIYGMAAQNPVKEDIFFDEKKLFYGEFDELDNDEIEILKKEKLEKSITKSVFPYQWGVWTTSWARYCLQQGINLKKDSVLYCDTDSVKICEDVDFSILNDELKKNLY